MTDRRSSLPWNSLGNDISTTKMIFYLLCLIAAASALKEFPVHPMNVPFMPGPQERIIGGADAALGDYPWQVSLQRFGSHFCGGSIVAANKVMSAAHCAVYQSGVTVNAGTVEYKNPAQSSGVISFVAHPQYNENTIDYDYSVITLQSSLTMNSNVVAIQLAEAGVEYPAGTIATTSGWGYVVRFPATIPDVMQVAQVPLLSKSQCQDYWGTGMTITDRMQCAGGNGQSSSCMGDSGGPLVVPDSSVASGYRLIGCVSWGSGTCSTSAPAAYAKISQGRSWIDTQL